MDYLDPNSQYIQHRLFRENCVNVEGVFIKDLRVINRNLSDIILVDNAAYSFSFQIENGIPIIPFYDNNEDKQLKDLTNLLIKMHNCNDVRDFIRNIFCFQKFSEFSNPQDLLEKLYLDKI